MTRVRRRLKAWLVGMAEGTIAVVISFTGENKSQFLHCEKENETWLFCSQERIRGNWKRPLSTGEEILPILFTGEERKELSVYFWKGRVIGGE